VGPYCCGPDMTIGDVAMAPYFARMCVLEYYRKFTIPKTEEFKIWHAWK